MPAQSPGNNDKGKTFTLHIGPTETPRERVQKRSILGKDPAINFEQLKVHKFHKTTASELPPREETVGDKMWSFIRFLSTAASIFIVLFFVMNWNAYKNIILNKLGMLQIGENPYIEGIADLPSGEEMTQQEMMELSQDPEIQKTQIPALSLGVAPPDTRIIIPRINKNVPVITISNESLVNRDWGRLEQEIQEALQDGVVHYPGTPFPGEPGNIVITGHSSYFVWDPGSFKDVFALLHDVKINDKIYIYYGQDKYAYEVYDTKVVMPTEVDVLMQDGGDKLTLITCTPVGTNLKRLIVFAKPI
ncbi:sortase [Patescibacteria group bacterium]|nr:sortase [Patescibacteria group bacterium]